MPERHIKIRVYRVTGLDPSLRGDIGVYTLINGYQHINANDADYVDIIHTDAGGHGTPTSTGTVDFWVNGGIRIQPGCPIAIRFRTRSDNGKSI